MLKAHTYEKKSREISEKKTALLLREIAVYQQRKQVSKLCVAIYVFLSSNAN